MESSILTSTKKILGIDAAYTAFDTDIITHINSVFFTLTQMGVGPVEGFSIADNTVDWSSFLPDGPRLNAAKTYMYLKVRMLFDPPTTSYLIDAAEKQIEQLEWRINVDREGTDWIDPDPPPPPEEDIFA